MSIMNKLMRIVTWITCCKKNRQTRSYSEIKGTINSSKSVATIPTPELTDIRSFQPLYVRTVQNFLLVWLDENIDEMNNIDCRNTITKLREVVNTVKTFTDIDESVNFITGVKEEKVFIIATDTLSKVIVPIVHDMHQVSSIYIICGNQLLDEQWVKKWLKIKGMLIDSTPIYEELKKIAQNCDQNSVTMNFVAIDTEISTQNLNKLEKSFMYTQILKEILLTIDFKQEHFIEFLVYCREQLIGNTAELKNIDKLEREYVANVSIWWYTYDYFLYSMVNRALRTMEVDMIIKMGFFVRDLHQQIVRLHLEQYAGKHNSGLLNVFRGQGLSQTDFNHLQKTQNGLMSFNNFLSTSYDRAVSLAYAESNQDNPDLIGVLFQITVDLSISSTPFANIGNVSAFKDEEEILFSMHSIFRIEQIKQLDNNSHLWQVDLTLTSDNDSQLDALTECIREETFPNQKGWYRLGNLLIKLDQFDKAHQVFDIMLGQTTDAREKGNIYHMLGMIHRNQGEYTEAVAFYEKSLEIYQKILPENHLDLTASYNNIGLVYDQMGEYSKALLYYEKALKIYENILPENPSELASFYTNIGGVYDKLGENSKALSHYEKALEIYQNTLPANHPHFANAYDHIGAVYNNIGEYSKALSYHEKALEIYQDTIPENHSFLATSYNNIGIVHSKMGEYSKAFSYYEKGLEISKKNSFHESS